MANNSKDLKDEYLKIGPVLTDTPPEKIVTKDTSQKPNNADIKPNIKKTLKDFLVLKTEEQKNDFTIAKGDYQTSIYSEQSPNSTPTLITYATDNAYDHSFLDPDRQVPIKKGKSPGTFQNGNTLLKSNDLIDNESNPVRTYAKDILEQNNRFSSDKKKYGIRGRDPNFLIQKYKKFSVGENGKLKINEENQDQTDLEISPLKMGEIAKRLLLNASGKEESAALLPGLQQMFPGLRTKSGALDVRRITQSVMGDQFAEVLGNLQSNVSENINNFAEIDPSADLQSISGRGNSFGTMNNYLDRFEGNSLSSTALSVTLAAATSVALVIPTTIYWLAVTNKESTSWQDASNDNPANPDKTYGKSVDFDNKDLILQFFGINKLVGKNSPIDATLNGIRNFVVLSDLLYTTGYYQVFFRNIIRRTFLFAQKFVKLDSEDGIEYTLKILNNVQNIKSSGLFSALNYFATIGEIPGSTQKDDTYLNPLNQGQQSVFKKTNALVFTNQTINNVRAQNQRSTPIESNISSDRLTSLEVQSIEETLSLEYVPFYFQDLKTNNVISFQAFLGDYTDDYVPEYTDESFFGRVEKIKLYKGTTRKVTFSFKIVAFSEAQHRDMWTTINLLTSMVYPKYDDGTRLFNENISWSIPFSQTINSSPMVRVRVGDLLVNNSPIFSANNQEFNIWLKKLLKFRESNAQEKEIISKKKAALKAGDETFNAQQDQQKQEVIARNATIANDNATKQANYVKAIKTTTIVNDAPIQTQTLGDPNNRLPVRREDIVNSVLGTNSDVLFSTRAYVIVDKFNIDVIKREESAKVSNINLRPGFAPAKVGLTGENPDVSTTIFTPTFQTRPATALKIHYKASLDQLYPINLKAVGTFKPEKIIQIYIIDDKGMVSEFEDARVISPSEEIVVVCSVKSQFIANYIFGAFTPEQQNGTYKVGNAIETSQQLAGRWSGILSKNAKSIGQKLGFNDNVICAVSLTRWTRFPLLKSVPAPQKPKPKSIEPVPEITNRTTRGLELWELKEEDIINQDNPILRSYLLNQGKGAAAYIDNISYKILDGFPWDVTTMGNRRPKIVDVSMGLTIIHDILPGTNYEGDYQGFQYPSTSDPIDDLDNSKLVGVRQPPKKGNM